MTKYFSLQAATGGRIGILTPGNELCSYPASHNAHDCIPLATFCLDRLPGLIFCFANTFSPQEIKIAGRPYRSNILPLGIEGGSAPHTVALFDLLDHSWISAPPLTPDAASDSQKEEPKLCGWTDNNLWWEQLYLQEMQPESVPQWIRDIKDSIHDLVHLDADFSHLRQFRVIL